MHGIVVKYLTQDKKSGRYLYRGRVPEILKGVVRKREYLKALGRTQAEALGNYTVVNQHFEHLLALAKNGVTDLTPQQQRDAIAAQMKEWGADPSSKWRDENEETWRQEAADKIVDPFYDQDTGEWSGVPASEHALASALLGGVPD